MNLIIKEINLTDVNAYVDHLGRTIVEPGINGIIVNPFPFDHVINKDEYRDAISGGLEKKLEDEAWHRAWGVVDRHNDEHNNDGKMVGHIELKGYHLESSKHRARLGMGLEKMHRQKGLGKELMKRALNFLNSQNQIEWIDLHVFEENTVAIKFYKSFGFYEIGKTEDAFRINNFKINDISMTKNLR